MVIGPLKIRIVGLISINVLEVIAQTSGCGTEVVQRSQPNSPSTMTPCPSIHLPVHCLYINMPHCSLHNPSCAHLLYCLVKICDVLGGGGGGVDADGDAADLWLCSGNAARADRHPSSTGRSRGFFSLTVPKVM